MGRKSPPRLCRQAIGGPVGRGALARAACRRRFRHAKVNIDAARAKISGEVPARPTVPAEILASLRLVCLDLPEAYEESAWVGTRWCIRKKNFAHVLMIDAGWPPAYAQAAACDGPACVLTFRLSDAKLAAPRFARHPFFRPVWWPNIAGVQLDARTDWDEIQELLTESYCVLAPRKLMALLDRVDT